MADEKKILIVDDSALIRRLLGTAIGEDAGLQVAYAAPNAELALKYLAANTVDLVLLDVEMPDMDGIEAVTRIRRSWPALPVLMCSSLTERGADVTIRALQRGASDYIAKPSASFPLPEFKQTLLQKIHDLLPTRSAEPERLLVAPRPTTSKVTLRSAARPVTALAIGCSTGGPNALGLLFSALRRPLGVPLFIVQHMPKLFTRLLAERLASESGLRVKEGEHDETVDAETVYLAPGGLHMTVARQGVHVRIQLNEDPPEQSCRPAVDVLFRGLARVYGDGVVAAVLTGMGRDGTDGARHLHEAGSRVLVQDAASCVVASMPSSVADAGWADSVLTVPEIADAFLRFSGAGSGIGALLGGFGAMR